MPPLDSLSMRAGPSHIISIFFPGVPQEKFDIDYTEYLAIVAAIQSRPLECFTAFFAISFLRTPSIKFERLLPQ